MLRRVCHHPRRGGAEGAGRCDLVVHLQGQSSGLFERRGLQGREGGGGSREDDMFLPPSRGGGRKDLPVRRSGSRARIVADLPPGEYVLDVFARMPQGDASYGFRLILEPRDPGGP